MIRLSIIDRFGGEATSISIAGEEESVIGEIITAKLVVAEYAVEIEDEDGELIPYEEFDHG